MPSPLCTMEIRNLHNESKCWIDFCCIFMHVCELQSFRKYHDYFVKLSTRQLGSSSVLIIWTIGQIFLGLLSCKNSSAAKILQSIFRVIQNSLVKDQCHLKLFGRCSMSSKNSSVDAQCYPKFFSQY